MSPQSKRLIRYTLYSLIVNVSFLIDLNNGSIGIRGYLTFITIAEMI